MKKLLFFTFLFLAKTLVFAQDIRYRLELASTNVFLPENYIYFSQNTDIQQNEYVKNKIYRVVQFYKIPLQQEQNDLQNRGVELLEYLSSNAYLVSVDKNFDWKTLANFKPRSVVKIDPFWKQSIDLREPPFPDYAKVENDELEVVLQWHKNISYTDAIAFLQKDNIRITRSFPTRDFVYATIKIVDIQSVTSKNYLWHLDLIPPPGEIEDNDSRLLHNSNGLDDEFTTGTRLNGEGVNVLVRDDGIVGPHIDFKNRVVNVAKGLGTVEHGDQVSGVLGGSGNLDPLKKGIATGTKIYVTDYDATFTDTTIGLHKYHNVMVTNTSYSDNCNRYSTGSQTIDIQLLANKKLMHVFSGGNNNGANCNYGAGGQWGNITGGHKQSKNSISVANLGANLAIEPTSSRGPAHDGRIKPDVSAHGTNVNAPMPNNAYQVNTGTSFSAPATAGVLAIMYQAYRLKNNGDNPDGLLMKNYLLNTATELGKQGPDFLFGWGNVNTKRAVQAIENQWFMEGSTSQDKIYTQNLTLPNPIKKYKQLKIMLNWDDKEASPNTQKALINDLDLLVKSIPEVPNAPEEIFQPWVLDHTPDIAKLNAAARKGRDSLNNVEQVVINNPFGNYKIEVKGRAVPFGSQRFYLTFDWVEEDVTLTHPIGNEAFTPGELTKIRWETPNKDSVGNVNISFSSDNGNTWSSPTKALLSKTYIDYKVPAIQTSKGKIRLEYNGTTSESALPFHIVAAPKNLKVSKACPDSVTLNWDVAAGVKFYSVLQLGNRYMDSLATFSGGSAKIKISNNFFRDENWFSVRSADSLGQLRGRRINAIKYKGGLLNCPQKIDLATTAVKRPLTRYFSQCGTVTDSVLINIKNTGLQTLTSVKVNYQFGNEPIVTKVISDTITPLSTVIYTFSDKITFDGTGKITLKVWANTSNDSFSFNDTLQTEITYSCNDLTKNTANFNHTQDFNADANNYPLGWGVINPDGGNTFVPFEAISANGKKTVTMLIDFTGSPVAQKDELYSVPISISDTSKSPHLLFDVAYGNFLVNSSNSDRLRVFVYDNCDHKNGVEIYNRLGMDLATANTTNPQWLASNKNQWRTEAVDISAFKGKNIYFGFQGTSAGRSILYLDNVQVKEYQKIPVSSDIKSSKSTICVKETVVFSAAKTGPTYNYIWDFGLGATPATASGAGPITVTFNSYGTNNVKLRTQDLTQKEEALFQLEIQALPLALFSFSKNNGTVIFNNTSTDANTYLWDFGDGTTSSEENPTHEYKKTGVYPTTLIAYGKCTSLPAKKQVNISSIVATNDIFDKLTATISPNPNQGNFDLNVGNQSFTNVEIEITDVLGKVIFKQKNNLVQGEQKIPIQLQNANAGIYFVKIKNGKASGVLKMFVEKL